MYTINIKTIRASRSKSGQYAMKEGLKDLLLNCKNFRELREISKNNKLALKVIFGINIFPDSIQKRVELIQKIKECKEHEILVNSSLRGMFIKIDVML